MEGNRLEPSFFSQLQQDIGTHLKQHLPVFEHRFASKLPEAMSYSLLAGGKRIRPILSLCTYKMCGGQGDAIYYLTSALEMFHTFSLIHDDLPCMDDDDLRRGKPTNHKNFGEAIAVLSGDALCVEGFSLLAKAGNLKCIEVLSKALGSFGMIGGQTEDILSENSQPNLETVEYIHHHKTAVLIEASILAAAHLAQAPPSLLKSLSLFGQKIGLIFQIVDDILDLEQSTEILGKDAGSDDDKNKMTYPAVIGITASKQKVQTLKEEALKELNNTHLNYNYLKELTEFIAQRIY